MVWAWGLNQYGQCGVSRSRSNYYNNHTIPVPTIVQGLPMHDIIQVSAGEHHSTAVTEDGELMVWGRHDSGQLGLGQALPKAVSGDLEGSPDYLQTPVVVPGIGVSFIGCGTYHNIAISREGHAYSWGFGGVYQTGLGPSGAEKVESPTRIVNTATEGVRMVFADGGGQFSVLAGIPQKHTDGTL